MHNLPNNDTQLNINNYQQPPIVIYGAASQKSVGTAFILAFLFGPLGLFYASVTGGLVMMVVSFLIGIVTLGIGLIFTWIGSIIWAVVAVNQHNSNQAAPASNVTQHVPVAQHQGLMSNPMPKAPSVHNEPNRTPATLISVAQKKENARQANSSGNILKQVKDEFAIIQGIVSVLKARGVVDAKFQAEIDSFSQVIEQACTVNEFSELVKIGFKYQLSHFYKLYDKNEYFLRDNEIRKDFRASLNKLRESFNLQDDTIVPQSDVPKISTVLSCPNCTKTTKVGDKFCEGCGQDLSQKKCSNCQTVCAVEDSFCEKCGNKV